MVVIRNWQLRIKSLNDILPFFKRFLNVLKVAISKIEIYESHLNVSSLAYIVEGNKIQWQLL